VSGGRPVADAPEDRVLTIPNLISAARIVGVAWFLWLLLVDDDVTAAAVLLLVIGSTDWVDGFLARRLGQESELGRKLDPIADRLALVAAVVGGAIATIDGERLLPAWLVIGLLAREAVMALAVWWLLRRTGETLHVRWLGKAATFLLYGAVPSLYLGAALGGVWGDVFRWAGLVAGAVGLALYLWVAGGYLREIRRRVGEVAPDASDL
jgi:cardiolipin synthase